MILLINGGLGPISKKSQIFKGHFPVSQFPLYLKDEKGLNPFTPKSATYRFYSV